MTDFKPVTGTFLDGMASDIPSQNWSRREWSPQFDVFRDMGMDTVVVIRVGGAQSAMFRSRVLRRPVVPESDRGALFLEEAERTGLRLYMGLSDSGGYWSREEVDWSEEIQVNLALIDELLERYGQSPAFHGWYVSHEPPLHLRPWEIWNPLIARMRARTPDKPVLLSPRFEGTKWHQAEAKPPQPYAVQFDAVLQHLEHRPDAAAFMDGHVPFSDLHDYVACMKPIMAKHHISFWTNLETFDRDAGLRFPPLDWDKMRMKMETVQPFVSKIITFEAPHFLSPLSMWESGRMLYRRYLDYLVRMKASP